MIPTTIPCWLSSDSAIPPQGRGDGTLPDETTVLFGKRVLLVEDEVFIAVDLRQALEDAGAEVTYARTLAKGMSVLSDGRFDAAILDVTLGARDTCRPIAEALLDVGTPFVLHSGDLDRQGEVISTLDAPVVAKPARPRDVVVRLARLLESAPGLPN